MATIGLNILHVQQLLEAGEVAGIPTETVYGLAGNAYNEAAILKIFHIKQRPSFDPLIVHANSIEAVGSFVVGFPGKALQLAKRFWPGPLTLLLEKRSIIPDLVTSGLPRVGVRVPQHGLTRQLLQNLAFPLAAPSANPFGYISPTTPMHVQKQLGHQIPYILDGGPCSIGIESTIIGFEKEQPVIYRLGGVSLEAIEQVVGPVRVANPHGNPKAPGMLANHYAPQKPLVVGSLPALIAKYSCQKVGLLTFDQYYTNFEPNHQVMLAPTGSLDEVAKNLFAALRLLDSLPIDIILATLVPDTGIGRAINDRLRRAAHQVT